MILTPIDPTDLPETLARFARCLDGIEPAATVFDRIRRSLPERPPNAEEIVRQHAQAVKLCRRFGMNVEYEAPQEAYSWDGRTVRVLSEPSVVVHEVAHLQVAAPDRRTLIDFGVGAGPETGRRAEANADRKLRGPAANMEEAMASLLGILWEAELGQPAIYAFLEQNWLEGGDSPRNRDHFIKVLGILREEGLIDDHGRPTEALRDSSDDALFGRLGLPNEVIRLAAAPLPIHTAV